MSRIRRRIRQKASRLGRRGAILITFGIMWLIQAVQVGFYHDPVPHAWLLSHGWQWRAAAWATSGLIALWAAFRRPGRDWHGFMALYIMGFWVVAVLIDAVAEAALAHSPALPHLLLSAGINACILAVVVITNGWREPLRLPSKEDQP